MRAIGDATGPISGGRIAGTVSEPGGRGSGYAGFAWIDALGPGGKRRQQRPSLPPEAMERFLAWRDAMLHLVDRCRAVAPRLAATAPDRFEQVVVPRRRRAGILAKRWAVDHQVRRGWLLAEWGVTGPPPGVRPLRAVAAEPSDRLLLLDDGGIVLERAGPEGRRPVRFVDDADFVQIVHREGLSEQLRRRLVPVFREAEMAAPFVPNRPAIGYADVWGKVARPGGAPSGRS